MRSSLLNVQEIERQKAITTPSPPSSSSLPVIEALPNPSDIKRIAGTPNAAGSTGYINRHSGWTNAEAAMIFLRAKVEATQRITFLTGTVTRLIFSSTGTSVRGAEYTPFSANTTTTASTQTATADLTILAAGAWSPTLIDLRGRVRTTAQCMAYIPLTHAEAAHLSALPPQLNLTTGLFYIPPAPPQDGAKSEQSYLKVARHAHGLSNPLTIPHPEPHLSKAHITISVPASHTAIPASAAHELRTFTQHVFAGTELCERAYTHVRLCHYADTPEGDFVVDYVPQYNDTLFIATGGSGHAFKFAPVLGEAVVQRIMRTGPAEFAERWVWKAERKEGEWSVEDGSRGGEKGLILAEEMEKGVVEGEATKKAMAKL
ncbi:hypothetical protein BT63DRAFT_428351 [Microthyrium microscopicum]|uniref:FAD dependent oxidoreductase domain-containing protein n=1 Tax=Microthyrium microscopicum TaxID=703497 RepID=A0A6A6U0B0_9PEZI|nr:hypothetical protein BT63DRAFT_428351 [Microthyrium microscopicum]